MNRTYSKDGCALLRIIMHTTAIAIKRFAAFTLLSLIAITSNAYAAEDFINYQYYEGQWTTVPDFNALVPVTEGTQETFALTGARADYFAFRYTAKLFVTEAATYTFYTTSDDGSLLYVDGVLVVNNDGLHGATEMSGAATLSVGLPRY